VVRFAIRRSLVLLVALVLVNALGFGYALAAQRVHSAQNPIREQQHAFPAFLPSYFDYAGRLLRFDLGRMPGGATETIAQALVRSTQASLGLLGLAFALSTIAGLLLGLVTVRHDPPGVAGWLMPFSTIGLAMPSFFLGGLLIAGSVFYVFVRGPGTRAPLPLFGFGWDEHLVFPALALLVRPTAQIARVTALQLAGELDKQYVIAARSLGFNWGEVRWRLALANVLAPIVLTIAGSFRLLAAELIVVEWLFGWPGLGRLLASTLILPGTSAAPPVQFLHPDLLASALTVLAALFLLADLIASFLVRLWDPRLRAAEREPAHDAASR
jgi:peptide/nickel transport system permease protein